MTSKVSPLPLNNKQDLHIREFDNSSYTNYDVRGLVLQNWQETPNLSIKGLNTIWKRKYGNYVPLVHIAIWLVYFLVFKLVIDITFSNYTCPFLRTQYIHPNYFGLLLATLFYVWTVLMLLPGIMSYKVISYGNWMYEHDLGDIKKDYMTRKDERFWIAVVEDKEARTEELVGTIALKRVDDKQRKEFNMGDSVSCAYIDKVGVKSEFRGKEIAKQLMKRAIEFAREEKYEYASLSVLEVNDVAIGLYRKIGMSVVYYLEKVKVIGLAKTGMIMKL